jgi:hypothetical protein
MAESIATITGPGVAPPAHTAETDPLHFLAGRRYTCYCGRAVVGTMLCPDCAQEMVEHFLRVARRRDGAP